MTTQTLLRTITANLASHGLDLVSPFSVQTYNSQCLEGTAHMPASLPPLPTFNRPSTLGLLVANTKAIWPHFIDHAKAHRDQVEASENPLDDFVADAIQKTMTNAQVDYKVRYTHDIDDKFVHFQRLGHAIGFAFLNQTMFLSVHEKVGPWFAYRAVIVLDLECDDEPAAWEAM
ncbi:UNVERIFIED_CONTAM: hypothetical protein HDU68_006564 [Siphonaria sp. JEL0065]|nr:hypothetical protein HDU68_006564 [Siphonaria sp. JEL0065]